MPTNSPLDVTNLGDDSTESRASFRFPARSAPAATNGSAPKVRLTSLDEAVQELSAGSRMTKPSSVEDKSTQERDPRFVYADLPSRFRFYDFTSLAVSNVKGYTQSKFSRAASERRTRHVVDAISSLLPEGITAWVLTIPDFYWLLYWIRLNFYTNPTLIHTAVCTHPAHIRAVNEGTRPSESLTSVHTVSKTTLAETTFDSKELDKFLETADLSFLDGTEFDLCPATIRDIVDVEENLSELDNYPEIEFLVDYSSFIQYRDPERGYADQVTRIKFIEQLDIKHLDTIKKFSELVSNYGVKESIKVTCPECRAEIWTTVSISAHSFL